MGYQDNENSESNEQRNKNKKNTKLLRIFKRKLMLPISIVGILFVAALLFVGPDVFGKQNNSDTTFSVSTLKKTIETSELSTFQAVYNGVAVVMNEKKPDKIDYHVSYKAKINAGFDFTKLDSIDDKERKKIVLTIPEITITDISVDISSLDYIFVNDKANTITISAQAYNACIADIKSEIDKESAIYDLAKQNASNIMKALMKPFLDEKGKDYELEILFGGVK